MIQVYIGILQAGIDISLIVASILFLLNVLLWFNAGFLNPNLRANGETDLDYRTPVPARAFLFAMFLFKCLIFVMGAIAAAILAAQSFHDSAFVFFSSPENISLTAINFGKYVSVISIGLYVLQILLFGYRLKTVFLKRPTA